MTETSVKNWIVSLFIFITLSCPVISFASPEVPLAEIVKLMEKEEYLSAGKLLDKFLLEHQEGIWHLRATYLKGDTNIKLSKLEDAANFFLKLLPRYLQLKDYTLLNLAEIYLVLGKESKSIESVNRLILEFPQSRLVPYSMFLLGKLYYKQGKLENAFKIFSDILSKYSSSDLVPELIFFKGEILEKQAKKIKAYETYAKLFHSFPLNELAIEAEEKMREMKKTKIKFPQFPPELISKRIKLLMKAGEFSRVVRECKKYLKVYKKGLIFQNLTFNLAKAYGFMRKRSEALKVYKSLLFKYPSGPLAPETLYNSANIYWNQGKYSKAIEYSKKVIRQFPSSAFSEKSFYVIGRILEQKKEYKKAIIKFKEMIRKYPHGAYVVSARWHIGWINYITGNYKTSSEKFSKAASKFPDSPIRPMFLYWSGKSNEKIGKTEAAHSFYKKVAEEYPYNYYGHRGKAKLGKKLGNKLKVLDPFLQRKLRTISADKGIEAKISIKDRFHYVRIKELIALGFYEDALEEIRLIAKNVSINAPEKILWVGQLYLQAKGYIKGLEIIEGFFNEISHKKQSTMSLEYWKLFFPLAFKEIVTDNAASYTLDPFLIEGLMRQESSFDPDSLSRSGAIGLMQLMPETGKSEFKKRYKKSEFYVEKLFMPEINVSLGSQHLAYLFKRAKGDPILALAGYNAGMSRALKWEKTIKTSDPDVFIERIPFRETRWYVKKVLRNYFNYIMLYGDGEEKNNILALNASDQGL